MIGLGLAIAQLAVRMLGIAPRPPATWTDAATWNDNATWSDTE